MEFEGRGYLQIKSEKSQLILSMIYNCSLSYLLERSSFFPRKYRVSILYGESSKLRNTYCPWEIAFLVQKYYPYFYFRIDFLIKRKYRLNFLEYKQRTKNSTNTKTCISLHNRDLHA